MPKDKRLEALLATLPSMECGYYEYFDRGIKFCKMVKNKFDEYPYANCDGDIRKCEREE
jgi:hypothetical protein